jgi:hypothetical protein
MGLRFASVSFAVLVVGCGVGGPSSTPSRPNAARAALTVAPNKVSCASPAPQAFGAALCVCEDLHLVGHGVLVTSSDALDAPVGVNGVTHVVGETHFGSGLVSWGGVTGAGTLEVGRDVVTPASVSNVGTTIVGGDLVVGGDVETVGDLSVGGLARVSGNLHHVGSDPALRFGGYRAPAGPPCGCDPATFLDVAALVAAARTDNDNAQLGTIDAVGDLALVLDGGRYYLSGLSSVGRLDLKVTKPSALFIDGDLETVGDDRLSVEEGASLDLYVNGRLENVGRWTVSDSTLAGVVRLYVGGKDALVQSVGEHDFVGALYAPQAPVELVGDTSFRGALFAKSLSGVGELTVDYASPAMPAAGSCAP